jgi:hypothetical protein
MGHPGEFFEEAATAAAQAWYADGGEVRNSAAKDAVMRAVSELPGLATTATIRARVQQAASMSACGRCDRRGVPPNRGSLKGDACYDQSGAPLESSSASAVACA